MVNQVTAVANSRAMRRELAGGAALVPVEAVVQRILLLRDRKVLLDADLAAL